MLGECRPEKSLLSQAPIALKVPKKTLEKIWRGEFIQLVDLKYESEESMELRIDPNSRAPIFVPVSRSRSASAIKTYDQWLRLFQVYLGLHCVIRPQEVLPMVQYCKNVELLANVGGITGLTMKISDINVNLIQPFSGVL